MAASATGHFRAGFLTHLSPSTLTKSTRYAASSFLLCVYIGDCHVYNSNSICRGLTSVTAAYKHIGGHVLLHLHLDARSGHYILCKGTAPWFSAWFESKLSCSGFFAPLLNRLIDALGNATLDNSMKQCCPCYKHLCIHNAAMQTDC